MQTQFFKIWLNKQQDNIAFCLSNAGSSGHGDLIQIRF